MSPPTANLSANRCTNLPGTGRRVAVAMSGGVDSSVAAGLLVEQGYDVIGMMMRLWSEPGTGNRAPQNRCCTPEQMEDARRVAEKLQIPFYVLFSHYRGKEPNFRAYFPFVVLAMFWAISIHTVTAFLFSANPARPFWHTALLGPRFIASAFASGPALIIITLQNVRKVTSYHINQTVIECSFRPI